MRHTATAAACIAAAALLAIYTDYDGWTLLLTGLALFTAREGTRT